MMSEIYRKKILLKALRLKNIRAPAAWRIREGLVRHVPVHIAPFITCAEPTTL